MDNKFFLFFLFITLPVESHTFTGMIGFYDGLSHPVIGIDHFLAMISVGIISSQIGGRAIWIIPLTFVGMMIVGGILGMMVETIFFQFSDFLYFLIEIGIILSVIILGIVIAIEKNLSFPLAMLCICIFGLFHGTAHGIEMPWASNPLLFALGFASGTATLHLFGVGIGKFATSSNFLYFSLRFAGIGCCIFGFYLLFLIFI